MKNYQTLVIAAALSLVGNTFATAPGFITHGSRDTPSIALTFDADMMPDMKANLEAGKVKSYENVPLLDYIERSGIKATFFLTGSWIELYPNSTKRLASNSRIELENHTYSHPGFQLPCFGLAGVKETDKPAQIEKTQALLKSVAGVIGRYIRFPGSCASAGDIALAHKYDLEPLQWDLLAGDRVQPNSKVIINKVIRSVQNGSIIVLHSQGGPEAPKTLEALKVIVPALKARGFKFVTVKELLGH